MQNRSSPIRCVVIDDEPLALKLVCDYIEKTKDLQLVFKTTHALDAVNTIQNGDADLIFLDIQMPEITGIEFMNTISASGVKVILTTAYTQYALAGYEHDVIDYLLKPITYERFTIAVNKARERLFKNDDSNKPDHLFVKVEYRLQKITFASILYIEGLRDYIAFHTINGKILSLENMKNMEAVLPSHKFIRIHKSFMINKDHIDYLERGRIIINKEYLPIGDTYKEKVMKQLGL
jgi:two-component system LytT family response regulator